MDAVALLHELLDRDDTRPPLSTPRATVAFTATKDTLSRLVAVAGPAIPTKDAMEVLKHFQIHAEPGRLQLVATDIDRTLIATTTDVAVTSPGTVVIPARRLGETIRLSPAGSTISVATADGFASVTAGNTTWKLKLLAAHDYPTLPDTTELVATTINWHPLADALRAVVHAACRDTNRAALMMVDVRGGTVTATDNARFQQAAIDAMPFPIQIPVTAVDDLLKLGAGCPEDQRVSIGETPHRLVFRLDNVVFVANKLTARFPDLEATLLRPALANRHPLTVGKKQLLDAIARVRLNADPDTSAVALHIRPTAVTVHCRDSHDNDAQEVIDAVWKGPERTIAVNHRYLTDAVKAHPGAELTVHLGDDTKTRKAPLLLRDKAAGRTGVVQQMLIDWEGTP